MADLPEIIEQLQEVDRYSIFWSVVVGAGVATIYETLTFVSDQYGKFRAGAGDGPLERKPVEKHVYNEQTKLLATALNTSGTSCFTVGIATPIAGYLYNVSNLQSTLDWRVLAVGAICWLIAAVSLHLFGRRALRGLLP